MHILKANSGVGLLSARLVVGTGAQAADAPALKDAFKDHSFVGTAVNRAGTAGRGLRRSLEPVNADTALIESLQGQKAPVHAIGSQTHVSVAGPSLAEMDRALTKLATLGLPIHITEFYINRAQGGQRGFGADMANNAATPQGGLVNAADRKLADAYTGLFRAFLKHDPQWFVDRLARTG
jgi:hypothetical protein